jgi:starch synthase
VKTGGLGDVAGSLPKALEQEGCEVKVFLPLYGGIRTLDHGIERFDEISGVPLTIGNLQLDFDLWKCKLPGTNVDVHFVDCPHYFHPPHPYTDDADEDERFIFFQLAVIESLQRLKWAPDVIHCNDWQTSLIPVFLKTTYGWDKLFEKTATLLSIHNIGYQGMFSKDSLVKAGLSMDEFAPYKAFEHKGTFCFLKAGIIYSEIISTVSPTYAHEIQTSELGAGLEGVLQTRSRDIYGVLNGIDENIWNPRTDKYIPYRYTTSLLRNKAKNRAALLKEAELPELDGCAVIGIVSRFATQKGFELLPPVINEIMQLPVQFIVLGSGDTKTEDFFSLLKSSYPDRVNAYIGYNNRLSHYITAGSDVFLMPSHYEPCGLNQMYSLNYGTVPIVRKTGGLADTVKDYHEYNEEGNGFSFEDYTPQALYSTLTRALEMFKNKSVWKKLQLRGMKENFTWKHSADLYIDLYNKAIDKKV